MTVSADPTCEGTKVYTFTYTDCAGNSAVWTYTYTIDIPRSPSAHRMVLYRELPGLPLRLLRLWLITSAEHRSHR